jgi:hypothetical protein
MKVRFSRFALEHHVLNELNVDMSGDEASLFDSIIGELSLLLTQMTLALTLTSGLNAKRKPLD